MRGFIVAVLLAASVPVAAQTPDPVSRWATLAAAKWAVYHDITYQVANNYECKLDVITPGQRTQVRPTIIYFHGGGWMSGTKGQTTFYLLPYLAKGMNVVNVEYRMAAVSLAPAAVEDARCALRWVHRNAKEYGFDLNRLVLSGGSAGGHLSLMAGMLTGDMGFDNACAEREEGSPKVAAIVNSRGPVDVTELLEGPHQGWFALRWFGSLPNRTELARRLSPMSYVRPGLPPIFTIHGDADEYVPYPSTVRFHEALTKAGVANELFTIRGGKHGGFADEEDLKMQDAAFAFLKRHGILP